MLISKIIHEESIYFNLHAEQTISSSYFAAEIGLYATELFDSTLNRITKGLDEIDNSTKYVLYLDFERIENAGKNLFDDLSSIKSKVKSLIFINLKENILSQLSLSEDFLNNPNNHKVDEDDKFAMFYFGNDSATEKYLDSKDLFEDYLLSFIMHFKTKDTDKLFLHESSSVYLTSYIDIKRMISEDTSFMMFCLYHLSIKVKDSWIENINDKPVLVCQNLNSSFISSVLSNFLQLDILILDHVGPVNTHYSSLNSKIEEGKKYIIVSDVVCLGTEVKITKNIISFLGGRVIGNVSIVKLDTLYEDDIAKEKIKNLSVFNINQKNNSQVKFKIKTAIDPDE
ncbi:MULTISPECIES: hypothetical protein [Flavobacterium]|jgi:hypothetical protein|uniref:Uncharacterized protein n=2 Tax=Flavobacterium TaxID=237 RepID=A0A085ZZH7_FLAHY|nr:MULTISPECIES: hypothetical protein [Flavobacterium]KFF09841.1 hypothetical protein IW20_22275 [Flavobacterium hydatis]MDL2142762.1 hypothetical protein [Flavobacterium tructae]OHT43735.1 hypothetical protein BHE19_15380 [Flavobacterium tructae]OXA87325.1 hypothetical protein B0A62_22855 [Flavobacterium hydatis]OXB20504.1 hypothetical protein B0A71_06765 [Flavobacterium tructae]